MQTTIYKEAIFSNKEFIEFKNYWLKWLEDELEPTALPFHYVYKDRTRNDIKICKTEIDSLVSSDLIKLSKGSDISLYVILVTAFEALLYKTTRNNEILISSPLLNTKKDQNEIKKYNNKVVFREKVNGSYTLKELLIKTKENIITTYKNQSFPFDIALKEAGYKKEDFAFIDNISILLNGIHTEADIIDEQWNLLFSFTREDNHISFELKYNSLLFQHSEIQLIIKWYLGILEGFRKNINSKIKDLSILDIAEVDDILALSAGPREKFPDKRITKYFEERVEKVPDATALVYNDIAITYKELNLRSNELASYIKKKEISKGEIVAIMFDNSIEMIISIFAVLKIGATYLPIDPDYPSSRIENILSDSNVKLILTDENTEQKHNFEILNGYSKNISKVYTSKFRPQVDNLDELQILDRSLIEYEKYTPFIGQSLMKNSMTLQFARGCVYNCAYCFKISYKYVTRSAENLFEEFYALYKLGIRRFSFVDDLPNFNIKETTKFYKKIIENKLDVHLFYTNGIRGDLLTKEYIDLMVEAGAVVMYLALETTSERLQKLTKKNLRLNKLYENINYILEKHPNVILETAILHGIPTETEEEAYQSLEYMKSLKWLHFPYMHVLKIYPNTEMANIAVKNGISQEDIDKSAILAYHELPSTLVFSKEFTKKYQADFVSNYFLLKERLLNVLPVQMDVFTEDELVQVYNAYLPIEIKSFKEFLDYAGIKKKELNKECLPEGFGYVPDLDNKLKAYFGEKKKRNDALKVLLIDVSHSFSEHKNKVYDTFEPPLGLMYLLTNLNKKFGDRVEGKIIKSRVDYNSYNELQAIISDFQPDVIGIRSLTFYKDFCHNTVSFIRNLNYNIPVVVGGPYATDEYKKILMDTNIDIAVIGEGELTFIELIDKILHHNGKLPSDKELKEIQGIAFVEKNDKKAIVQNKRNVIVYDRMLSEISKEEALNPTCINSGDDIAYIIYTSGSTGIPKGTLVQHNNLENQIAGMKQYFNAEENLNYILLAAFTFDVSVMHIFLPLITGAKLNIPDYKTKKSTSELVKLLIKEDVNVLNTVPALIDVLTEDIDIVAVKIKHLLIGGERFNLGLLSKIREKLDVDNIYNIYGPTETTINATIYKVDELHIESNIPIGKPLNNYSTYILDDDMNIVPEGILGNLFIAGEGVTRGYLNNPELTLEKFNRGKFENTGVLYDTGDIAKWTNNGNIEFIDRCDNQIKLRGYRIELGEIENKLVSHSLVDQAVVVMREEEQNEKLLCAYYKSDVNNQLELCPSIGEYYIWDDLMYYVMTNDELRNDKFKYAINSLVKNKVVVDVGTGSDCILSLFCVEAGAAKVYAVEIMEEHYKAAKQKISDLGLDEKIKVIHGDITKLKLPEKVDVFLANQCGTIGSSEGGIIIHNTAQRFLKNDGRVIPEKCITKIAAVTLPDDLCNNPKFHNNTERYLDKIYKKFNKEFNVRLCLKNIPMNNIISDSGIFEDLDFTRYIRPEDTQNFNLKIKENSRFDGFVIWICLHTVNDAVIDTLKSEYVWWPVYIPAFTPGIRVSQGDEIIARCIRTLSEDNFSPDYLIEGELIKTNGSKIKFVSDLSRVPQSYKSNEFYKKLYDNRDNREFTIPQSVSSGELHDFMAEKLPEYMIPRFFMHLDEFPQTKHGKIDFKALPKPKLTREEGFVSPQNDLEYELRDIFSEIVGVTPEIIGIDSNFFKLGGHSLKATILGASLHEKFGVNIPIVKIFKLSSIRLLAEYISSCKIKDDYKAINAAEKKEYYPVSSAQKRMYLLQQVDTNQVAYNMGMQVPLNVEIEKTKLKNTFNKLINRHDSLRTSFNIINGQLVQRIHNSIEFVIDFHTCRHEELDEICKKFVKPFDLNKTPLLRIAYVSTDNGKNYLLIDMHHIITDGTSHELLLKEFWALYNSETLADNYLQYKDFSEWQNSTEQQNKIKKQEKFWLQKFEGEVQVLDLPYDYQRPLIQKSEGEAVSFALNETECNILQGICMNHDVTLFMCLLSILNILLSKLSGSENIVIGTPIAARRHSGLGDIIGMFVNTLALKNSPEGKKSYDKFLTELKEETLEIYENQEYAFEDLVENLTLPRDAGRNPLFEVMLMLQNQQNAEKDLTGAINKDSFKYKKVHTTFDLIINAVEADNNILLDFEYSTALFKREKIERFIGYFRQIIKEIQNNKKTISEIDILSENEKQQLLYNFNNTETDYPKEKTIHQLFEEQVERTPNNIAIYCENEKISYKELSEKSDKLANLIINKSKKNTVVGLMSGRSIDLIVGILGILKSGNAYLPINKQHPEERNIKILSESQTKIVVTEGHEIKFDGIEFIHIKNVFNSGDEFCKLPKIDSNDLAYVIYTSGSTGTPKGVMVSHRNVVNFVTGINNFVPDNKFGTMLSLTTISFDIFGLELYVPLFKGFPTVLVKNEDSVNPNEINEIIKSLNVSVMQLTPSRLSLLLLHSNAQDIFKRIELLFVGGEELPLKLLSSLKEIYKGKIYNMYGPTETTIWSTYKDVSGKLALNIGQPMSNTKVFILDKYFNLQPVGVRGEIHIGGDGVSKGYLNNKKLTAEKFIDNPFASGESLYRTGDVANWLPDGKIEFSGRMDHQVKVLGYRIELGEIESVLLKYKGIKESIVLAIDKDGEKYLCAYIVSENIIETQKLISFMNELLPAYMIPSYFVNIDEIPLTTNGKVNRKKLPPPEVKAGEDYVRPINEMEIKLVNIWSEILNIKSEEVSVIANFFTIGGNSLKATNLILQIHAILNVKITLGDIFLSPTIRGIAKLIEVNRIIRIDHDTDESGYESIII